MPPFPVVSTIAGGATDVCAAPVVSRPNELPVSPPVLLSYRMIGSPIVPLGVGALNVTCCTTLFAAAVVLLFWK